MTQDFWSEWRPFTISVGKGDDGLEGWVAVEVVSLANGSAVGPSSLNGADVLK